MTKGVSGFHITYGLIAILFLASCYYDGESNSICAVPTSPSLANDVRPILSANCYSCHSTQNKGSGGNIDLQDYTGLKVVVDNGKLVCAVKHLSCAIAMPRDGNKLDDCSIQKIETWVNKGGSNN